MYKTCSPVMYWMRVRTAGALFLLHYKAIVVKLAMLPSPGLSQPLSEVKSILSSSNSG